MFKITMSKGFQMTFENELTISVQFGAGNYCENHHEFLCGKEKEMHMLESTNAEIAIWDKNNNWITGNFTDKGDGAVAG